MKNKLLKVFTIFFILMIVFSITNSIWADDWWGAAGEWFGNDDVNKFVVDSNAAGIIDTFKNMINLIGTVVIVLVTIVLGIKYMLGSIEDKADIKESLITLLIACIFFFGWQGIWNLLTANETDFIFAQTNDASLDVVVGRIYSTIVYILQFAAVVAIIVVGIKYIFAGASGKANLKAKSGQFIIGAIMAFATISLLTYVSNVINSVVP